VTHDIFPDAETSTLKQGFTWYVNNILLFVLIYNWVIQVSGWSGDWIPVGERFTAYVQTAPGNHPASCTMGTGSFPGVNSGQGVTVTPHPLLVPWSRKGRAIPLLPLWALRPVQSLGACTRVHFTTFFNSSVMLKKFCIVQLIIFLVSDEAKQLHVYPTSPVW